MLAKLETAYLGLLRFVILIAATIALLVAIVGLISAVPPILHRVGVTPNSPVQQPNLADFIRQKKAEGVQLESSEPSQIAPAAEHSVDVTSAANNFAKYLNRDDAASRKALADAIDRSRQGSDLAYSTDYEKSLRVLSEQLLRSKGTRLSPEHFGELLDWHKVQFQTNVAAAQIAATAETTKFYSTLAMAGGAFLFFALIVFIFIFVKIERSLRLVQVVRVTDAEK